MYDPYNSCVSWRLAVFAKSGLQDVSGMSTDVGVLAYLLTLTLGFSIHVVEISMPASDQKNHSQTKIDNHQKHSFVQGQDLPFKLQIHSR